MDFSNLFQVAPVQMPDPVGQMAKGLSLAQMVRQNRMGQEEDALKQLDRQAEVLATQAYAKARQTGDPQSALNELSQQGEAGSLAIRKLMGALDTADKNRAEVDYKRAQTGELTAKAEGERSKVRKQAVDITGSAANAIATDQVPVNQSSMQMLLLQAKHAGTPDALLAQAPTNDPAAFKSWAAQLAAAAADPKAQAEIWKIGVMTPIEARKDAATAAKTELETSQMPAELKVRQDNARSSAVSAGAAATNAQTNRMQYENPNLQHIGTPDTGISVFSPRTGAVTPAVGSDGKPIAAQPKLTEKQRNDISTLQSESDVVEAAIAKAKAAPNAFGFTRGAMSEAGPMAETLAGRADSPEEREARAAVFNTVSSVIKERAGTAQSKQEAANVMRFLPGPQDNVQQIEDKLRGYQDYMRTKAQGVAKPVKQGEGILAPKSGGVTVNAGGKTYTFPSESAAQEFKVKAGLI